MNQFSYSAQISYSAQKIPRKKLARSMGVTLFLCAAMVLTILSACTTQEKHLITENIQTNGMPEVVDPATLDPGLEIRYIYGFWRHVDEMPKTDYIARNGKSGKPILTINHRFGKGLVFDSGKDTGVGVQMKGFIRLEKQGEWQFQIRSNDGVTVFISGVQVVDDPEWHSDRFSNPMTLDVEKAGYHNLMLTYFQRKGTATLEFYWKPPGENQFAIVPSSAYWHQSNP